MEEKPARIGSFAAFWPYYLSQHQDVTNRRLHFAGTTCSLVCLALGLLISRRFLLAMPLTGYGFAWAGHFFFEKNRPATFEYPLWSLAADFRMWWRTLRAEPLDGS